MKLPDLPPLDTQMPGAAGFGTAIAGTEAVERAGQYLGHQIGTAGAAIAQLGESIYEGKQQVLLGRARAMEATAKQQELTRLEHKTQYTGEELVDEYGGEENIPPEVLRATGPIKDTITDDNGNTHEKYRDSIPSYAVNSDLYRRRMAANLETISQQIESPGLRRGFLNAARNDLDIETAHLAEHSAKQATADHIAEAQINASDAARAGHFAEARDIIRLAPGMQAGERKEALHNIDIEAAKYPMDEVAMGTDATEMESAKAGLQAHEVNGGKFDVVDKDGNKTSVDTAALTEHERRMYVRYLNMSISRVRHAEQAELEAQARAYEKAGTDALNQLEMDHNVEGLRNFGPILRQTGLDKKIDPDKLHTMLGWANTLAKQATDKGVKEKGVSTAEAAVADAFSRAQAGDKTPIMYNGEVLDPRTMNVSKFALENHMSWGDMMKLQGMQTDIRNDVAKGSTSAMKDSRALAMKKWGFDESDITKSETAANFYLAYNKAYDAKVQEVGHPLNEKEATNLALTFSMKPEGYDLPDIPPTYSGIVATAYPHLSMAEQTEKFHTDIEPKLGTITDAYERTGMSKLVPKLSPVEKVRMAIDITEQEPAIKGILESRGLPYREQDIVDYYFKHAVGQNISRRFWKFPLP